LRVTYLDQLFRTPEMYGITRSYEMARRLVKSGHQVQVVTSWSEPTEKKGWFVTTEDGVTVHWYVCPYSNNMGIVRRLLSFFVFLVAALHRAQNLPADIVFASSVPLTIAIPGAFAAWRQHVPMVLEVRDLWPEIPIAIGALPGPILKALARALERFAYRSSARIVAASPGMRDGISAAGYPSGKISVIPNSADIDLFGGKNADATRLLALHPELKGRKIVLYAGTFGRINGVQYLVDVAARSQAQSSPTAFVAVGEGAEFEAVRSLSRAKGVLDSNLFIYPPIPKLEIPHAFAAATITLSLFINLKEMWNNSANKFFDGLAAARPVAINYLGWQADLIRKEDVGVVLPHSDPVAAADLINARLADAAWLEGASQRARRLAETHFSRDKLAKELEGVLLAAVQKRQAPVRPRAADE
jgi:glycosyltransferase involved in cell wall biosynthesis